jgi:hypothetical protein
MGSEGRSIVAKHRGNKEGTIYKRKNGRWCAQFSVNGRRLTRYGKTQGEVRQGLKDELQGEPLSLDEAWWEPDWVATPR